MTWQTLTFNLADMTISNEKRLHIFNGFHNPYGGSELEALGLFTQLSVTHQVRLWATSSRASVKLAKEFPISRVGPWAVDGGIYVFVGAHWHNKIWPFLTKRPDRLIYVYNSFHPKHSALASRPPRGWPKTEFVFISEFQKRLLELDGVVHPSPIDIRLFVPKPASEKPQLVVGRLSRDTASKHNRADLPIYRWLAQRNIKVRLQGATCLINELPDSNIEIAPEGAEPAACFLQGLDIFYYRTGDDVETFGRVVIEAMACGLPVICHKLGGYADWIIHAQNGFLFSTDDEAREILDSLVADRLLRQSVGANARRTVESMYCMHNVTERMDFYVR